MRRSSNGRGGFEDIRRVILRTLEELPSDIRDALARCGASIDVLDEPPPDVGADTYGTMCGGTAYDMESPYSVAPEPPRIELYVSSFRDLVGDRRAWENEVRLTVIHEIGHFIGLGEEDLEDV
ncbi:MAG: metallopeptidase family protein [Candidatus Hydrogenedentota bacterium]